MQPFPHHYNVLAKSSAEAPVNVSSQGLPDLSIAAPTEFDGPGDLWSPETLFVGAIASCFILTFRAVAKAAKVEWLTLNCEANGTLDRVERVTQFNKVDLHVNLQLPSDGDVEKAERLLEKAEKNCLIVSSLKAEVVLHMTVSI